MSLDIGPSYVWWVTAPTGANQGWRPRGLIARRAPPESIRAALEATGPDGAVLAFAREGLWYDAFAAVSERIAE